MTICFSNFYLMYFVRELTQISGTKCPFIFYLYMVSGIPFLTIDALSVLDDYSQEICSNKEVFRLVSGLVRLPDKVH